MVYNWRLMVFLLIILAAFIPCIGGIDINISSGDIDNENITSMKINDSENSIINFKLDSNDKSDKGTVTLKGPVPLFQKTITAKDGMGKIARIHVKVVNAPNGLTYSMRKGADASNSQPLAFSELWLTVPKADYIICSASATSEDQSSDVSIEGTKAVKMGNITFPFEGRTAALDNYHCKASATDNLVSAQQTATVSAGGTVNVKSHAGFLSPLQLNKDCITDTTLNQGFVAGLDSEASSGSFNSARQTEHMHGTFTSRAKGHASADTRTSNYGSEYDLNMVAVRSSARGVLGYYVGYPNSLANNIQKSINIARSGDTINVAEGTYQGNFLIDKTLEIKGTGVDKTIIDGKKTGSVFTVDNNNAMLSGITIQNGLATYGGGINNKGTLTVTDSIISGNEATGDGGGIYNKNKLTVKDCTVELNIAKYFGGGIANPCIDANNNQCLYPQKCETELIISSSTIAGNRAKLGGGIANSCKMTVTDSSISGNAADDRGGGLCNNEFGDGIVKDSTISKNTANDRGGGIFNYGTMMVTGSTISENTANAGLGGGIFNDGTLLPDNFDWSQVHDNNPNP